MKSINFNQLVAILKNNNFNLYYKSGSKSRSFKDKSNIVIDSESISYKHGIITEKDVNSIYLFDNQFIAFTDYKNCKKIEIQLLSEN
jgi:hypothetical protein